MTSELTLKKFREMKKKEFPLSLEDFKQCKCCFAAFVTSIEKDNNILIGNEKNLVELISTVAEDENLSKCNVHTLVRYCALLATPVMQDWLKEGVSSGKDVWLAEKLFPALEYILRGTMTCSHVKKFLYESFANVADFYPLTVRTIYTEIHIRNEISNKVSEERKSLEKYYNELRQW